MFVETEENLNLVSTEGFSVVWSNLVFLVFYILKWIHYVLFSGTRW